MYKGLELKIDGSICRLLLLCKVSVGLFVQHEGARKYIHDVASSLCLAASNMTRLELVSRNT